MSRIAALSPGVALAAVVAVIAFPVARLTGSGLGFDRSPISPVLVGVLTGMMLRNLVSLPGAVKPGVRFAAGGILRLGIILLGIRLSLTDVMQLGLLGLPVVVCCVAAGVAAAPLLSRGFALPWRLGVLIGVGTSICGVSAIAAAGPVMRARDEEVAYATIVITVFGMLAMVVYPFAGSALFGGNETAVGLFLGTAIHDTSQVNGAGILYADLHAAPRALDVAVVTKLVRNLFLIVVIPLMAILFRDRTGEGGGASGWRTPASFARLLPLFVLGFVSMAALRTIGDLSFPGGQAFGLLEEPSWRRLCSALQSLSGVCLVTALSAVGLGTDLRSLSRLRLRPFLLGLGAALAVGLVSFAVVSLVTAGGRA